MRRLHPATMIIAFLPKLAEAFRQVLPLLLVSYIGGHGGDRTEIFVSLIGVLSGFGAIGAYVTTRFDIVEGQITYRTGWIFRKDRRIPLAQVQNVNLRQGILERLLKVVTLEVETAGGKGAELHLSVLSEPDAERLRVELMSEASHPLEVGRDEDVYRLSRHDLLLGAVTEHHTIAFLISALPLFGLNRFARFSDFWLHLPLASRLAVGFGVTVLALVAGWIFGAVQYAIKYGGFTVRREPGVTRVAYGLLTKVQVAIRPVRIEYALLTSTPWQRLVGRETLSVGTAGSFGEQGTVAKLALMIPKVDTPAALEKVIPNLRVDRLRWNSFPPRYFLVLIGRGLVGLAFTSLFLIPFYFMHTPTRWFFVVPPLLVLSTTLDLVVGAKRAGYSVSEGFIAVRQGFFRQKVEIMPMERVDVAMLHQPPLWRGRDLVSLSVKGMVHGIWVPMVPRAAFAEVEKRLEQLAAGRRAAKALPAV